MGDVDSAKADRDTVGGVVEVRAGGVAGPRLVRDEGDAARCPARAALMGIQAVKGVEIGEGFGWRDSAARRRMTRSSRAAPRDQPRGRDRGWRLERRGHRGPRGDEAAPTLMRPLRSVDLESGEPGRLSSSAATRRPSRRSRSSRRRPSPSSSPAPREEARRRRWTTSSRRTAPISSASRGNRGRSAPGAHRLHGRRKDLRRPGGRAPDRQALRRHRRRDRSAPRADRRALRAGRGRVPPPRGRGRRPGAVGGRAIGDRARGRSVRGRSVRPRARRPPRRRRRDCVARSREAAGRWRRTRRARELFAQRDYGAVADAAASDVDGVLLAALGIRIGKAGRRRRPADRRSSPAAPTSGSTRRSPSTRRRWRRPGGSGASFGWAATGRSSPTAEEPPPTWPASSRRRICVGFAGSPCRQPWSARSTLRSAARPRSISPRARTSSARSTTPTGS